MEGIYEGRTQLWMIVCGVEEQDTEQAMCDEEKTWCKYVLCQQVIKW